MYKLSSVQLPAYVLPGLTLVISPLVALMADQLQHLPPLLPGGLINSSQVITTLSLCSLCIVSIKLSLNISVSYLLHRFRDDINQMIICLQTTSESTEVMSRLLSGQIKVRFLVLDKFVCG